MGSEDGSIATKFAMDVSHLILDLQSFLTDVVRTDSAYQAYLSDAMGHGVEDFWQAELFRDGSVIDALPPEFPGWDAYDDDESIREQWHALLFNDVAEAYVYIQAKYAEWYARRIVISLKYGDMSI